MKRVMVLFEGTYLLLIPIKYSKVVKITKKQIKLSCDVHILSDNTETLTLLCPFCQRSFTYLQEVDKPAPHESCTGVQMTVTVFSL